MKALIQLLTDSPAISERIKESLAAQAYTVETAPLDRSGLEQVLREESSLLILDLTQRPEEGLALCQQLRESSLVLIFLLIPAEDEQLGIRGLELGADDFLTEPFYAAELAARVSAHLRRVRAVRTPTTYVTRDLQVDLRRRTVTVRGKSILLTPTEFRLLVSLIRHAGQVVPKKTLLAEVWGSRYVDKSGYLKLYIRYLRQKIERDPSNPEYILTDWGVGYRLLTPEE